MPLTSDPGESSDRQVRGFQFNKARLVGLFHLQTMCHTCDYINNEILRKAKEAADALLALVKPEPDALKQDGTQQG